MATASRETQAEVDGYLASGPPYYGDSRYEDAELLKQHGAAWEKPKRLWFAKNRSVLAALIETGKWRPRSLARPKDLVRHVRMAEQALLDAKLAAERAAAAAARDAAKRAGPTDNEVEHQLVQWLGIKKDTDSELQRLHQHGLGAADVRAAVRLGHLGPRSGFSNAARLLMALDNGLITVDEARAATAAAAAAQADRVPPQKTARTSATAQGRLGPPPPPEDDCGTAREEDDAPDGAYAHASTAAARVQRPLDPWVATRCEDCRKIVFEQFLDCVCPDRVWQTCPYACGYLCTSAEGCDRCISELLA